MHKESIYFYTLHKCASTLFASYILRNVPGLQHVDYAQQFFAGKAVDEVSFAPEGFVYGPIRLSSSPDSEVFRRFIGPVSDPDYVRDKKALFFVRDPRDVAVSKYYSFGWTHGPGKEPGLREKRIAAQERIRRMTPDEYVLGAAQQTREDYEKLSTLIDACERSTVLRYEDMICTWESFAKDLTDYLELAPDVLAEIYERSRPRAEEDLGSHRRSGKPGGFSEKLAADTIAEFNKELAPVLEGFGYGL